MIELYLGRLENNRYNFWDNEKFSLFYIAGYPGEEENKHFLVQLDDDYLGSYDEDWYYDDLYFKKYIPPSKILSYIKKVIVVEGELKETRTDYLQRYGESFNEQRKTLVFGEGALEKYMYKKSVKWEYVKDNAVVTWSIIDNQD